jgi:hypothetical protein
VSPPLLLSRLQMHSGLFGYFAFVFWDDFGHLVGVFIAWGAIVFIFY